MVDDSKNSNQQSNPSSKVDNKEYLTGLKELPDYTPNVAKKLASEKAPDKQDSSKDSSEKVEKKDDDQELKKNVKKDRPYRRRDIFLNVINLILLLVLIVLLGKLGDKADQLKKARSEQTINTSLVSLDVVKIDKYYPMALSLEKLFLDEEGIVNFVNDVEKLKSDQSSIVRVSFTSQKPIEDKTKNYGVPVIIEMRGNWGQFANDIAGIRSLPYLFRTVKIDVEPLEEEGLLELEYGGILYVKDGLVQN